MLVRNWWKILAVALLGYSLLAGLLIPLGAGITEVSPGVTYSGAQMTMKVSTYNTFYAQENGQIKARIRLNDKDALNAVRVQPTDDNHLELTFILPKGQLPIDQGNTAGGNKRTLMPLLEITSPKSGYSSLEAAVIIRDTTGVPADAAAFASVEPYDRPHKVAFPFLPILNETIRNLYFHVPLWFGMMFIMLLSFVYSIRHLNTLNKKNTLREGISFDALASSFASVGLLYGILGLTTGAMWARYTWGTYWSFDVKQNMSAVAVLMYGAYFVLRGSFEDEAQRARLAAVYNIFAFAMLLPLLFVIPRLANSLHPGADGNPAFKSYDLDSMMRFVFYPAVIGFILLGVWLSTLLARVLHLQEQHDERASNQSSTHFFG